MYKLHVRLQTDFVTTLALSRYVPCGMMLTVTLGSFMQDCQVQNFVRGNRNPGFHPQTPPDSPSTL